LWNEFLHLGFGLDVRGAPDTPAAARYFAFDRFPASGIVEDDVAGVPVAVVRDEAARSAFAYDRRVGGQMLRFDVVRDGAGRGTGRDRPLLRERGGRRAWWLRSGAPVEGSGAAAPLEPAPGSVWEDAAWHRQHPAGTTWTPSGE